MTGKAADNGRNPLRATGRIVFTALTVCWLGAACKPQPLSPTPTPADFRSTPDSAGLTPEATASPEARPAASEPAGWIRHAGQDFVISLPESWQVLNEDEELQAAYREFAAQTGGKEARNPMLAGFLGGEVGFRDAVFWAFAAGAREALLVESLNIRRVAPGADPAAAPEALLAPILEQYELLGIEITGVQTGFEIDGHPAATIAYRLPVADGAAGPVRASGRQYFVAAGDLWILTYTSHSDREASLAGLADQSARSFRVR